MKKRRIYNLLVVDDHSIVLKGIEFLIKDIFYIKYHSATNYEEAIEILKDNEIHLVLLDLNIDGLIDFDIIDKIREIQNDIKILIFSAYDYTDYSQTLIEKRVDGYLNKCNNEAFILNKIYTFLNLYNNKSSFIKSNPKSISSKDDKSYLNLLSEREIQVAKFLINGSKGSEICTELNLQKTTVSTYKKRIFEKLNIVNTLQLAKIFE